MGSFIEVNDTLQITKKQGFPEGLDFNLLKEGKVKEENFKNKVFEFKDKPAIRIYQMPPVRNFLVENVDGKWIYWGLVHILEVSHNYEEKKTSGKFKIIHLFNLEEMKVAFNLIDRNEKNNFFN